MKVLSADDIFKINDITIEPVAVPEWGGQVYVRKFSASVQEEFESLLYDDDGELVSAKNVRARVVALAVCDQNGNPLFTVEQAEDLAKKSNAAIQRVYDAAAKLNKLRKKDRDDEKKESESPQPAGSPTA